MTRSDPVPDDLFDPAVRYLIQVDGKLPNLALMKLSTYFKSLGHTVRLVHGAADRDLSWPEGVVYASSIFDSQSAKLRERVIAVWGRHVIWGGTGVQLDSSLADIDPTVDWDEIEPDYTLYPEETRSIGFTQRGCRLKCPFCVVPKKEGPVRETGTVASIWRGDPWPKHILLLDNDFFGQPRWRDRIEELRAGNFKVSFNQGINVRKIGEEEAAAIASVDYRAGKNDHLFGERRIYTAWDNAVDGPALFKGLERLAAAGVRPGHIMVYMLIGYWPGETHMQRDSRRRRLREFGARPYPMPYVRTPEMLGFQRWVIGAYDKGIPWKEWEEARFNPRKLTRRGPGVLADSRDEQQVALVQPPDEMERSFYRTVVFDRSDPVPDDLFAPVELTLADEEVIETVEGGLSESGVVEGTRLEYVARNGAQLEAVMTEGQWEVVREPCEVLEVPLAVIEVLAPPAPVFTLNPGQASALSQLLDQIKHDTGPRITSLCGPAGSGKTTLTKKLVKALVEELRRRVTCSAMTGRAARRLREVTGRKARTFHAALYHGPEEVDNKRERRIELVFASVRKETDAILIVDEASMMDQKALQDVERSPFHNIILVGDGWQLPPVSDDRGSEDWSVFQTVPGPQLVEVMRTSGAIVEAATYVRERQEILRQTIEHGGSCYEFSTDFRGALRNWFDDQDDHVLITWTNATRMRLNLQIREILGHVSPLPEPGEPVVVRKNDHQQEIVNGDMFYVDEWLGDGPEIAGIKTRYLRLRTTEAPPLPATSIESITVEQDDRPVILTALSGRECPFDGFMPYVGLDVWRKGVEAAQIEDPPGVVPVTFGYCLTAHQCQGSEYRRATTLLFNDLSSRNFRKPTTLPDGSRMSLAMRWTYTAISRAKERSTLVIG